MRYTYLYGSSKSENDILFFQIFEYPAKSHTRKITYGFPLNILYVYQFEYFKSNYNNNSKIKLSVFWARLNQDKNTRKQIPM